MAKQRIIKTNATIVFFDYLWISVGCALILIGVVAIAVAMFSHAALTGVACGAMMLLPGVLLSSLMLYWTLQKRGRLVFEDEYLLYVTVTGRVRGQIPYWNIQSIEMLWDGIEDASKLRGLGINYRRASNRDTFWFLAKDNVFHALIPDQWSDELKNIQKKLEKCMERKER